VQFEYLAYVLGKFSGRDLEEEEKSAAFQLLSALPKTACIKDFIKAAANDEIERSGLSVAIAETLQPLLVRLELNLPYAGRFASLFAREV
jgi:hypothetical protein